MNAKSKNIMKILLALGAICAIAVFYVFFTKRYVESATTVVYVAKQNIDSYQQLNEADFNNLFETKTVHSTIAEISSDYVTSYSDIQGLETSSTIYANSIALKSMWGKRSSGTRVSLPVDQSTLTSDGLTVSATQPVTIVGYTAVSGKDVNGKEYSDSWIGILTNKAYCVSTTTNSSNEITRATFEIKDTSTIGDLLMFANTGTLYYINGQIDDLSKLSSGVLYELYCSTSKGFVEEFSLATPNVDVLVKDSSSSQKEVNIMQTNSKYNLQVYSDENDLPVMSWRGLTASAYVYHYDFDGNRGDLYGYYTTTSTDTSHRLTYDASTRETSLPIFNEVSDNYNGFYQVAVTFYNPTYNEKQENAGNYTETVIFSFVIDTDNKLGKTHVSYIDCANNFEETIVSDTSIYENISFMEGYEGVSPEDNYDYKMLTFTQDDTDFAIPIFNKIDTKKGLTPSDAKLKEFVGYFSALDEYSDDIYEFMKSNYNSTELQHILDVLEKSSLNVENGASDIFQYITLQSLGFEKVSGENYSISVFFETLQDQNDLQYVYYNKKGKILAYVDIQYYNDAE